jgi:hypothetical protein
VTPAAGNRATREGRKMMTDLANRLAGSCVVCAAPTDTALIFRGVPEWCCAGLMALGVPEDEAIATFHVADPQPEPDGSFKMACRVCRDCVRNSGTSLPEPAIIRPGSPIPVIIASGVVRR